MDDKETIFTKNGKICDYDYEDVIKAFSATNSMSMGKTFNATTEEESKQISNTVECKLFIE